MLSPDELPPMPDPTMPSAIPLYVQVDNLKATIFAVFPDRYPGMVFEHGGAIEHAMILLNEYAEARAGDDGIHLVDLGEDGYTLKHPLACRPDLFACVYNDLGEEFAGWPQGRYQVVLEADGVYLNPLDTNVRTVYQQESGDWPPRPDVERVIWVSRMADGTPTEMRPGDLWKNMQD